LHWSEYREAVDAMEAAGLTEGFLQEDLMELDTSDEV